MTDSNTPQTEHCQGIKYYSCVDAIVFKQDLFWVSENSLWKNDYWRSVLAQSLRSAHILPEVFTSRDSYCLTNTPIVQGPPQEKQST